MYHNKVIICGVDTSNLPKLKKEEKEKLLKKALDGDEHARDIFIFSNLRLVLSIIKRFNKRGENLDDLFQVGCIGLMKGLDNFDLKHGVQFSTYAVPMIIGEIRRYLRDNTPIRISRSIRDTAYKALAAKERLTKELGKEVSIALISKEINISIEDINVALDAIQEPVSLFAPVFNDGGETLFVVDQISDEKNLDSKWIEKLSLVEGVEKLSPREKSIINMRFSEGRTQTEIATDLGISQAQVSRLEKNALKSMKKYVT